MLNVTVAGATSVQTSTAPRATLLGVEAPRRKETSVEPSLVAIM